MDGRNKIKLTTLTKEGDKKKCSIEPQSHQTIDLGGATFDTGPRADQIAFRGNIVPLK